MILEVGTKAPAFTAVDQKGNKHKLTDYKGMWVLLYFYPKDNTPGCTKEACTIRDAWGDFKKKNAVVLGVSKDSQASHESFAEKYELNFPLLVDEDLKILEKYGAWQMKVNFGKKYMGVKRMSYLIDPKGKIAKVYKSVKPAVHAAQVLKDLDKFQTE